VAFEWICLAAVHESARGHLADLASGRPFCPVSGAKRASTVVRGLDRLDR
jgi:hypothetical protein